MPVLMAGIRDIPEAVLEQTQEAESDHHQGTGRCEVSVTLPSLLLVQATAGARQSTVALLKDRVGRILEAQDGFDALCELARERPPVILMDFHLPRLGGFHTCALLRNSPLFHSTRIILLGEDDNLVDRTRAELAGADAYLVKPWRRDELLALLEAKE